MRIGCSGRPAAVRFGASCQQAAHVAAKAHRQRDVSSGGVLLDFDRQLYFIRSEDSQRLLRVHRLLLSRFDASQELRFRRGISERREESGRSASPGSELRQTG